MGNKKYFIIDNKKILSIKSFVEKHNLDKVFNYESKNNCAKSIRQLMRRLNIHCVESDFLLEKMKEMKKRVYSGGYKDRYFYFTDFIGDFLKNFKEKDFKKLEERLGFDIRIISSYVNNISKPSPLIYHIISEFCKNNF